MRFYPSRARRSSCWSTCPPPVSAGYEGAMRESERFLRRSTNAYHLLSAAALNNSRNRNFVHRKDHGRIEAGIESGARRRNIFKHPQYSVPRRRDSGIPGSPRPDRRRRTARPDLGERRHSRLVATAAEDRLSLARPSHWVTSFRAFAI
jgi:hypothetical protein